MSYNIISTTDMESPEKRIRTLLLLNPKIELNINMAVIKYCFLKYKNKSIQCKI